MKLLVLDNYDSFTYNLVHLLHEVGVQDITVARNDKISLDDVAAYESIVLSPGPGIPNEAGIMPDLVRRYAPTKKILGVCLGHQCIGEVFGAGLVNMPQPVHGKAVRTQLLEPRASLFGGLPPAFMTGRYHSWLVAREGFPACLRITAQDERGDIMALEHREYRVSGVQFHPESVLSEQGAALVRNFVAG
jgi:anthranilate synthase component 2